MLLQLEGVGVRYGNIEAVKGIDLHVDSDEIVTLIGGNGAGKTTTLKTISGVQRAFSGRVLFEGTDITEKDPHDIVRFGLVQVPEGRRIFPRMTTRENLEMGAYQRKDSSAIKSDMDRVFDLFPILKERIKQAGGTLSGGEQQMLAIGRGLMAKPRLLMLDEPSMGLAPIVVERIFETIAEINRQGTTILLIEQNAQIALTLANRGYVIESGEIVLEGGGDELLANDDVRKAYLGET
ncbi:MAG TPA: ABC transporter ATP-binding protein [Actinomycetota bacterium]|nr:ABC transporter ATP-binding protein [Actinomycetota bacterium]